MTVSCKKCGATTAWGTTELCPSCTAEARSSALYPNLPPLPPSMQKIHKWVIEFGGHDTAHVIPPRGYIELRNSPQIRNFRPMRVSISAVPKARLDVEIRVANVCFPLGCCDVWDRKEGQLPTAFIADLVGVQEIDFSNTVTVRIFNRYRRLSTIVAAQVDGVYHA